MVQLPAESLEASDALKLQSIDPPDGIAGAENGSEDPAAIVPIGNEIYSLQLSVAEDLVL